MVRTSLGEDEGLLKRPLNPAQWRNVFEQERLKCTKYYPIYTDASQMEDGDVGTGWTNGMDDHNKTKLDPMIQITNAELVAINKGIDLAVNKYKAKQVIIYTDSRNSCQWLKYGNKNNYHITEIWNKIQTLDIEMIVCTMDPKSPRNT